MNLSLLREPQEMSAWHACPPVSPPAEPPGLDGRSCLIKHWRRRGVMADTRDQRKDRPLARPTIVGHPPPRSPTLEVSELQAWSYCELPCPAPKLSPMRLDSLFRSAGAGEPRGSTRRALRATTASFLGQAWAKTISGSQEKDGCLLICGARGSGVFAERTNSTARSWFTSPLSSHGVTLNPLSLSKHPGSIRTVGSGGTLNASKDFPPSSWKRLSGCRRRAGSIPGHRKDSFPRRMLVITAHRPWLVMTGAP
ncbi:hypothetical protein LZ30DRAFT_121651 [Colletotrichum cereale]|nr:hypothetical protein LZ30DRAFT_121651 [Colletotrichum cereale]